mgnify:CR=1 FL=1
MRDNRIYKDQILVLYSGGADSTLLLEIAKRMGKSVYALLIDYGQLHKEELEFAKKYLDKEKIQYNQVSISGLSAQSGLTGDGEKGKYDGVAPHYVPGRNTMFLAIAASEAESQGITNIWIGADMSDFYGEFPDCKQVYFGKINDVFKVSFSYPIIVEAPLLGMSKQMVLDILKSFEIKMEDIYSGYGQFS